MKVTLPPGHSPNGSRLALTAVALMVVFIGWFALCHGCTLLSVNVYPSATSQPTSRPSIGNAIKGLWK